MSKLTHPIILLGDDTIKATDWVRPLRPMCDFDGSNEWQPTNCYSGGVNDTMKWIKVSERFGPCWIGYKIKDFSEATAKHTRGFAYEFARGPIPIDHIHLKKK